MKLKLILWFKKHADVNLKWNKDGDCYEFNIIYEEKAQCIKVPYGKIKNIYTDEDFSNLALVTYSQNTIKTKEWFYIKSFYINLNYEGALL